MFKQGTESTVQAVITDIEGTTTAISFIYSALFPYIRQNLRNFLIKKADDLEVTSIINEVKGIASDPQLSLDQLIQLIFRWMDKDFKVTPLKALQGLMWEDGYQAGSYQGHIYEDAYRQLNNWKLKGLDLYVYSSGSVKSQKMLFGHSLFGDITPLFSGYFDTNVGNKKETTSYIRITQQLNIPAPCILFLSDSLAELDAAKHIGMQTTLLCRDTVFPEECSHPVVKTFNEITL